MKVIVAIDDSDFSSAALESVAFRSWSQDTEFLVISVVEPDVPAYANWHTSYVPLIGNAQSELLNSCAELLEEKVNFLKERLPGHLITGKVLEGNIRDSIVKQATDWGADFIVMGSHGRTGFNKFLLGSVAESIVAKAPCSVEIIRRTAYSGKEALKDKQAALTSHK